MKLLAQTRISGGDCWRQEHAARDEFGQSEHEDRGLRTNMKEEAVAVREYQVWMETPGSSAALIKGNGYPGELDFRKVISPADKARKH